MKDAFISFAEGVMYNEPMFKRMEGTVEGSMHHREANVLVHTQMVLGEYYKLTPEKWDMTHVSGALACLFHDVGKPAAEVDKFTEERGAYHSYPGHEIISAREWENWAVDNYQLLKYFFPAFDLQHIYNVGWMVEHHLPYSITNPYKLAAIYKTGKSMGGDTFANVLTADGRGRINDNEEAQAIRMKTWMDLYDAYEYIPTVDPKHGPKRMHMLIGVSGSGKSSLVHQLLEADIEGVVRVFSLDDLRTQWYGDLLECSPTLRYEQAHQAADADPTFVQRWQREFTTFVKAGHQMIIVDGTNLTSKKRRFFLDMARAQKYLIHGVYVTGSLATIKEQQASRTDKLIDETVVDRQYSMMQYPSYNEFDFIHIL